MMQTDFFLQSAVKEFKAGNLKNAETLLVMVLAKAPDHAEAIHLLAHLRVAQGRRDDALTCFLRATRANPFDGQLHVNLAKFYVVNNEPDKAIAWLNDHISYFSSDAEWLGHAGLVLLEAGDPVSGRSYTLQAVHNGNRDHVVLIVALELLSSEENDIALEDMAKVAEEHLAGHPLVTGAFIEVAYRKGEYARVAEWHRRECRKTRDPRMIARCLFCHLMLPDFDGPAISALTRDLLSYLPPEMELCAPEDARDPEKTLRIGALSRDFSSSLSRPAIEPMLKSFRKHGAEVILFSTYGQPGNVSTHMREAGFEIHDVSKLSYQEAAKYIHAQNIDVIFDLGGFTAGPHAFIHLARPAPICFSDYFSTMGMSAVDFILLSEPHRGEQDSCLDLYTENVFPVAESILVFDNLPDTVISPVPPCQHNGYVTFGSFNSLMKLTNETLSYWEGVLAALPTSRLIIQSLGLEHENRLESFRKRASEMGLPLDRIDLYGWIDTGERNRLMDGTDVALDCLPYCGSLTTLDILGRGVPVVTRVGQISSARTSYEYLDRIGLQELATFSKEDYVAVAMKIATDVPRLTEFRKTLREKLRTSILYDQDKYGQQVMEGLRQVWRERCALSTGE